MHHVHRSNESTRNCSSFVVDARRPGTPSISDIDSNSAEAVRRNREDWYETLERRGQVGHGPVLWFDQGETRPHVRYCLEALVRLGVKDEQWIEQDLNDPHWHYTVSKEMSWEWSRNDEAMLPEDPRWKIIFSSAIADQMEHRPRAIKPGTEFRYAIEKRRKWFESIQYAERPPRRERPILVPELGRTPAERRAEQRLCEEMAASWRKPIGKAKQGALDARREQNRLANAVETYRSSGYSDDAVRAILGRQDCDETALNSLLGEGS